MTSMLVPLPEQFSFDLAVSFLLRSPRELLHRVEGDRVFKALKIDGLIILCSLELEKNSLSVKFLSGKPDTRQKEKVANYIREWFDLETDLMPFYEMAKKDPLLKDLVIKYRGYRIVGQPDLFESLIWAVLGQQINLQFAYTLKERFVEKYGERIEFTGRHYFLFPSPEVVSKISPDELLALQFSRQKAKYTIGIAEVFMRGEVSKEKLKGLTLQHAKGELIKINGVGNWTANYALMKTFRYPDAFPLEDAGVHNAIKNLKKMKAKPTLDQVRRIFKKYKGWEAYATLYLWKSL
jgi:DNA-3-methyladenine glycosylase II